MSVTPIFVPRLGLSVQEVTLLEWLVADGSVVSEGQAICLVETDKVENEVGAPASGTIRCTGGSGLKYLVGAQIGEVRI